MAGQNLMKILHQALWILNMKSEKVSMIPPQIRQPLSLEPQPDRGGLYIKNGDPMQTATAVRTAAVSLDHGLSSLPK